MYTYILGSEVDKIKRDCILQGMILRVEGVCVCVYLISIAFCTAISLYVALKRCCSAGIAPLTHCFLVIRAALSLGIKPIQWPVSAPLKSPISSSAHLSFLDLRFLPLMTNDSFRLWKKKLKT
jgi:hypothetical protein